MSDASDLIVAAGGTFAIVGPAVAFVWAKIEKRVTAAEAKVEECEAHREADKAKIDRLTWEVRREGHALRMLFDDLHARDPGSYTLRNVGTILATRYQPELAIPEDWTDLLARIEEKTR